MRQFINGSDLAFAVLERRASGTCVVFYDEEMPPGASPTRARVGFQVNRDGSVFLYVDKGIQYSGSHPTVREWLESGGRWFPSFAHLKRWVREVLRSCYPPRVEELTDLAAIQQTMRQHGASLSASEEALFHELSAEVRGQDRALRTLARAISHHLAKGRPRRPLTLFAVGSTGVGKTKSAEVLSRALRKLDSCGTEYSYVRLDMVEYQEPGSTHKLFGAPQSYIGYGEGAQLIDALVANPKTVVLFDEIEKAHSDVWRALMNVMDAGRISSPSMRSGGREVDCRAAVFFFTSNLDASGIIKELQEHDAFGNPVSVDEVCRTRLRRSGVAPELVGRIGRFLVFEPLTAEARIEITALSIVRVASEYGVSVSRIAPAVISALLRRGQTDGFGARPIEYLAEDMLAATFAEAAASYGSLPIEVTGGPPFRCVPLLNYGD